MKKLHIEELTVDSFETHPVPQVRGTVGGNMATILCPSVGPKCQATDYASCESGTFCC